MHSHRTWVALTIFAVMYTQDHPNLQLVGHSGGGQLRLNDKEEREGERPNQ